MGPKRNPQYGNITKGCQRRSSKNDAKIKIIKLICPPPPGIVPDPQSPEPTPVPKITTIVRSWKICWSYICRHCRLGAACLKATQSKRIRSLMLKFNLRPRAHTRHGLRGTCCDGYTCGASNTADVHVDILQPVGATTCSVCQYDITHVPRARKYNFPPSLRLACCVSARPWPSVTGARC